MTDKIINWYNNFCYNHKIDLDLVDILSMIDSKLTDSENITIIEEKLNTLAADGTLLKRQHQKLKLYEEEQRNKQLKANPKIDVQRILKNDLTIALARTNEGKTSFLCELITQYQKDYAGKVYAFGLHPELVKKLDIIPFFSLLELENISSSIIVLDEIGKLFDMEDRKKRKLIENTLRLVVHRGNKLLASGLPTDFKKFLCAKATCFLYKSLEFADLINGSKAKDILLHYENNEMGAYGLHLPKNQVLCYDGSFWKEQFNYNPEFDTKKNGVDLFAPKCTEKRTEKESVSVPKNVEVKQ